MFTTIRFATFLSLFLVADVARADQWAAPKTEVYKSANGQHELQVVPPKDGYFGTSTATLKSTAGKDGPEVKVWQVKFVNVPYRALVADDGKHVVTIDTYARLGHKHVIVAYDVKGTKIADLELEQFLTREEIAKHAPATVSSRHWTSSARFTFDLQQQHFVVTFTWGKTVRLSLKDGKIVVPG